MPSLGDQLNSFKAKMRSAPVLGKRTATARPPEPATTVKEEEPSKKQKLTPLAATMYNMNAGGSHKSTQFLHAMEYLKRVERPVTFEELQSYLSFPVEPLMQLLHDSTHLRVQGDTVTYVSKFGVYSADDLLRYLNNSQSFQGLPVKDLKDGWSGALPTIANLEAEQKIIVLRNRKDNSPRLIWPNKGGAIGKVDPKFVSLWQSARVPSANDLPGNLERVGLKPSSVDPSKVKREPKAPQEKKAKRRTPRTKITNTHMKGLLKDF